MAFQFVKYHLCLWSQNIYETIELIYNAYLNESLLKYYISILEGGGGGSLRVCLFCLFRMEGSKIWENMLI